MDTPAVPEPNPVNPSNGGAAEHPEHQHGNSWQEWFTANATALLFLALAVGFVIWKDLYVLDLVKVAIGLGLVIFIHELGHFLAAKWCDVHVETFSIGFGRPIPGCHFKYGETTYKIGWIPLGGFVKMVGEGENADSEEAEEDPRSFKNKPVGQRMLIISAGVIMNIFLASICFVIAYMHGVEETASIVGSVEAGSPAWRDGLHTDCFILEIDGIKKPAFEDVRPAVMSTSKGETVRIVYRDGLTGDQKTLDIEPVREGSALFPTIGIGPAKQLVLEKSKQKGFRPFRGGSPAATAQPGFEQGDRIIASSSDPADYKKVTPITPDGRDGATGRLDYFEFLKRMEDMRGEKMIVRVQRGDGEHDIVLEPAYYHTTGLRMGMGRVSARRVNSPAAKAKVIDPPGEEAGIQPGKADAEEPSGDKIIQVEVPTADGKRLRWQEPDAKSKAEEGVTVKPLDPVRLPYELKKWSADAPEGAKVLVTVLRPTGRKEEKNEQKRVTLEMDWDKDAKYYVEHTSGLGSPISIPGLGIAYFVNAVVDHVDDDSPAAKAGAQKGDVVKQFRPRIKGPDGKVIADDFLKLKQNQWAGLFEILQQYELQELDLKVERAGNEVELTIKPERDETWPMVDRGLYLKSDTRVLKADNIGEALTMGMNRTVRLVRVIYSNLYSMVFGRVSIKTMSGPLSIADVSYKIAGENIWQFILFIGMINVNLAVINFLPIPVLDGGHMVFLIYEKIRGKPAPESVLAAAMYTGLAMILALMCFVIFLDVKRLFF